MHVSVFPPSQVGLECCTTLTTSLPAQQFQLRHLPGISLLGVGDWEGAQKQRFFVFLYYCRYRSSQLFPLLFFYQDAQGFNIRRASWLWGGVPPDHEGVWVPRVVRTDALLAVLPVFFLPKVSNISLSFRPRFLHRSNNGPHFPFYRTLLPGNLLFIAAAGCSLVRQWTSLV